MTATKITVEDIDLEITRGRTMYIRIDVFKFVKDEDYGWIEVYMETNGDSELLEEIYVDVNTDKELRKEAIKWIFKKVEIEA